MCQIIFRTDPVVKTEPFEINSCLLHKITCTQFKNINTSYPLMIAGASHLRMVMINLHLVNAIDDFQHLVRRATLCVN
jgi:hypothetical protein